ncbi:MAG: peptide-methionine (R)-S-oxide reductase MsrB [bacterium]|nr:peptide-methionine (R)-S-oxide reductase MsrB [bacterium]
MKHDKELEPELYKVAREKGTEAPFTGKYVDEHAKGMYACAICGNELFSSDTKFDSSTGWPAFAQPAGGALAGKPANILLTKDTSHGMVRTEVSCKKCGAHLGHVFDDGPAEAGGKRYCINSVCLDLKES